MPKASFEQTAAPRRRHEVFLRNSDAYEMIVLNDFAYKMSGRVAINNRHIVCKTCGGGALRNHRSLGIAAMGLQTARQKFIIHKDGGLIRLVALG